MVDVEQLERVDGVLLGGSAVGAGGLQPGVAKQLGDDDEVGAAAHEPGRERVAQNVGRDIVVLEAGGGSDRGDDVVRALDRQPAAALVEKQGRSVCAGPVGAFVKPAREGGAQLAVDRDLADLLALRTRSLSRWRVGVGGGWRDRVVPLRVELIAGQVDRGQLGV